MIYLHFLAYDLNIMTIRKNLDIYFMSFKKVHQLLQVISPLS